MNDCSGLPGQGHEGQVFKVVAVRIGHQAASQRAMNTAVSLKNLTPRVAILTASEQNKALAPV